MRKDPTPTLKVGCAFLLPPALSLFSPPPPSPQRRVPATSASWTSTAAARRGPLEQHRGRGSSGQLLECLGVKDGGAVAYSPVPASGLPLPLLAAAARPAFVAVQSTVLEGYDQARSNGYEDYRKDKLRRSPSAIAASGTSAARQSRRARSPSTISAAHG
jgi:hypothetical protein